MKHLFTLAVAGLFIFSLSSCYTVQNFQSARTVEKDRGTIGIGLMGGSSYSFDVDNNVDSFDNNDLNIPFADWAIYGRYGVSDRFDLGIHYGMISGNFVIDGKYMAVGDQNTSFVLSPGLALSSNLYAFGSIRQFQVEVPIHTSYYVSDNFGLIFSPRYVGQNSRFDLFRDNNGWVNYVGLTAGFEFGRKVKGIFGVNYLTPVGVEYNAPDISIDVLNVGFGVTFPL